MHHNRESLLRVNSDIEYATLGYDFAAPRECIYCEGASEYAHCKTEFIKLHERAFRTSGSAAASAAFDEARSSMEERMRRMHKELSRAREANLQLIADNDEKYSASLGNSLGAKFDAQAFITLFKAYAEWMDEAVPQRAAYIKVPRCEGRFWVAPNHFETYVKCGSGECDSEKLKTHIKFQTMLNTRMPNAVVSEDGSTVRLRDSDFVFHCESNALLMPAGASASLRFDASTQSFKLEGAGQVLYFKKRPSYTTPPSSYPELGDWAAFRHAFLQHCRGEKDEIASWGGLAGLVAETRSSNIKSEHFDTLLHAFGCKK